MLALRQFRASDEAKDVNFTVKYLPYQLYPEATKEGESKYEWYKKSRYGDSEDKMKMVGGFETQDLSVIAPVTRAAGSLSTPGTGTVSRSGVARRSVIVRYTSSSLASELIG